MSDHHKETFITKYIFSIDHKMIAKQFLVTGMLMGIVGMLMSILFRLQLSSPNEPMAILSWFGVDWNPTLDANGNVVGTPLIEGVLDPNLYLSLVTMHGTILVFWVLTAGLSGTFANFLIPLQIGARDMASGFINMLSYWFFFAATVVLLISLFVQTGPASAGWTIYPPLSAVAESIPGSGLGQDLWLISMTLFVVSSLLGGLNYIVTVLNLRTKGMSMSRLPLTIWAIFITAILGVLSFPVLLSACLLLVFDRTFGTSFYLSDIIIGGEALHHTGGSPILFEHLFWFLGHPEVYIILLPALGIVSEVMSVNSRKPIFGYRAMVLALIAIAFLSFIVWGHHMFITGMDPFLGSVFTFTTLLIAIPSAVKVFNYLATLWKASIRFTPAMLFAIAFVSTFITGGKNAITSTITYNGSSFSSAPSINTGRARHGAAGTSTSAGVIWGGSTDADSDVEIRNTEDWNGTAWSESALLSVKRDEPMNGAGTASVAMNAFGLIRLQPNPTGTEDYAGPGVATQTVSTS